MSAHTFSLSSALSQYLHDYGVREPAVLQALREETRATFEAAPMQISPEQGQFFRFFLESIAAKHVLEIGTFTGYSSICMALALPDDGHLTCCDISFDWTRMAEKYWRKMGLDQKITLHIAPAIVTLQKYIDEKKDGAFDFAFIDADKPNYHTYYELCLQVIRPGGVIAVDNVLWGGEVINPHNQDENTRIIRALNEKIHHDDRVSMCMLPIGDGLTLVRKNQ